MKKAFFSCSIILLLASCISEGPVLAPLEVVPQVDLARYTGRWYEIATFPQRFQKGCTDSCAEYRLQDDGKIEVLNSCFRNGKVETAKGKAWVADKSNERETESLILLALPGRLLDHRSGQGL